MLKEDKRIIKTKRLIKDTLFELLNAKEFEKITVAEIAQKALISKATFYYHYEDKYDFVNKLVDDLINEYRQLLSKRIEDISNNEQSNLNLFSPMITKVFSDYKYIKKIKMREVDFKKNVEGLFADVIERVIQQQYDLQINNPTIVFRVLASMSLTLADQLIEQNEIICVEKNIEIMKEISTVCNNLFFNF